MKTTMKASKFSILKLLSIAAILVFVVVARNPKTTSQVQTPDYIDASMFLDHELFLKGENNKVNLDISGITVGGVVPHHMLAASLLSGFFGNLNGNYERVIIIGPNHEELGDEFAVTSDLPFKTAFDEVNSSSMLVDKLRESGIRVNNEIVGKDHSIGVPVNYFSKYLPHGEVAVLLVKETNSLDEIQKLADLVSKDISENDLVLASVDFSHYLDALSAKEKDRETVKAIEDGNYDLINSWGSEHLDSSTSIILLDMIMHKRGTGKFNLLINTNSSDITGYNKDVTSYILGVYYQ